MSSINATFSAHHEHCDSLFAAAEEAANRGDWPACETRTRDFAKALEAHLDTEEQSLFPAFEEATGMLAGPTVVMRSEHQQMRALTKALTQAAVAGESDAFFGTSETLLVFMEQHNRKEEGILYPLCDQSIASAQRLAGELAAALRT